MLFVFGINLEDGLIALGFSVEVTLSCDPTQVTLYSSNNTNSALSYTLTGGSCMYSQESNDPKYIALIMSPGDVVSINGIAELCSSESNCFITITGSFINSTGGLANTPTDVPQGVFFFHQPAVSVDILNSDVDLDAGQLTIQFNELITTVNVTLLTITKGNFSLMLSGPPQHVAQQPTPNVTIALQEADIDALKQKVENPPNTTAWRIHFPANAVQTEGGISNNNTLLNLLILPDTTGPMLLSFTLDMNTGVLSLTFDEIMDSTVTPAFMYLMPNSSIPSAKNYTLDGSNATISNDLKSFEIVFSETLLMDIQTDEVIAKGADTTYLYLAPLSCFDVGSNTINEGAVIQASTLITETERPMLVSFTMQIDFGTLRMTFSEPMKTSSLRLDQISLLVTPQHNLSLSDNEAVQFTESNTLATIVLTSSTLNELKILFFEANQNLLYIVLTADAIQDTSSNSIIPIPVSSPKVAADLQLDSMHPTLLNFSVVPRPPQIFSLNFTFSEYMNLSSFDISALTLVLESGSVGTFEFSLSGGSTISYGYVGLEYQLSAQDLSLNNIRELYQIAYFSGNISIGFTTDLVTDLAGLIIDAPMSLTIYQSMENDPVAPFIESFSLDLDASTLQLNFSEPMIPLNVAQSVFITNGPLIASAIVNLNFSNYSNLPFEGEKSFVFSLVSSDVSQLLANDKIATNVTNTYIIVQPQFGIDINGSYILSNLNGTQASEVILPAPMTTSSSAVVTSSSITSADISQTTSSISTQTTTTLQTTSSFSTISSSSSTIQTTIPITSSILFSGSSFSSNILSTSSIFTQTSSHVPTPTSSSLLFSSSSSSLSMQVTSVVTTSTMSILPSSTTSSVVSTSSTTHSSSSLLVSSVVTTSTMSILPSSTTSLAASTSSTTHSPSSSLVSSVASPSPSPGPPMSDIVINSTSLDMNMNRLMVAFSENILLALVGENGDFYLTNTTDQYTLKNLEGVDFSSPSAQNSIIIDLMSEDVLNIKVKRVNASWSLGVTTGAVADTDLQAIKAQVVPLTNFTADSTPPMVSSFDLDMDKGKLRVTFNEPIEEPSVFASDFYIASTLLSSPGGYQLTGSTIEFHAHNSFNVSLTTSVLNAIKFNSSIATDSENTNLFIKGGRLQDYFNNSLSPLGNSVPVNNLFLDMTSPNLLSYELDLNSGFIEFIFDEPVNVDSVNPTNAFITSDAPPKPISLFANISGEEIGGSNLNTRVSLILTSSIDELKFVLFNSSSAYLSLTSTFVEDVFGNSISAIDRLATNSISADKTPPQAKSITAESSSPGDGSITFTFNEYILLSSLDESKMSILIEGTTYSGFSEGSWSAVTNESVKYQFGISDLSMSSFGADYVVANHGGSIRATFGIGFATDLGSNSATIPGSPLSYSSTKHDLTSPVLTAFDLDTDTGTLVLSFSEPIILRSLTTGLQLQNTHSNPTIAYNLTSNHSGLLYGTSVIVKMSNNDTANLVNVTGFVTDINNTFILPTPELATDYSGNSLSVAGAIQASSVLTPFTPETAPMVLSGTLNLNSEVLVLYFDKSVDASATNTDGMTITNGETSYTIKDGSAASTGENDTIVNIKLGAGDINSIKYIVASSQLQFNISLDENSVFNVDNVGNKQQSIEISLIKDTTGPNATSFSFDLDVGTLFLTFSEPVSNSTYNTSKLYLSGSQTTQPTGFQLSDGTVTESHLDSTILILKIPTVVINEIKGNGSVATVISNTYLFLSADAFQDIFDNGLVNSSPSLLASNFTADDTAPSLDSYSLDLNSGILTLSFNEPVDIDSFDPSGIKIFNTDQTNSVTIADYTIQTSGYSQLARVSVTSGTLNNLKNLLGSENKAYLSIPSTAIDDTSGNMLNPITDSSPTLTSSVIQDSVSPILTGFTAGNEIERTLTLTFDEFIQPSSWNGASLVLLLNSSIGSNKYSSFADGTTTQTVSDSITYTFSNSKFSPLFSVHYQQAYYSGVIGITFESGLIEDVSGNNVSPQSNPVYYDSKAIDPVKPELTGFELDLDSNSLVITFSESVVLNAVQNNVKLQNSASSPSQELTLSSSTYSSQNGMYGETLTISLSSLDVKSLASNSQLATSVNDTFLVLNPQFAVDYSGNFLASNDEGIKASSFMKLSGPVNPIIIAFDLDLDSDQLTLHFDTAVDVATFKPNRITLVNDSSVGVDTFQIELTNTTVIAQGVQKDFRILISNDNVVSIKRNPLCYNKDNCYATFAEGVAISEDNLPSQAVITPLQVSIFSTDVTPPRFLSYPVFDLNSGFFTVVFSEPVNGSSTDFTQVQFANTMSNPSESITLTGGFTSPDHVELDFHLSTNDLNRIKYLLNLCTTASNCWLRLPSFILTDIGSNPFLHSNYKPGADASFHKPSVFIPDTTPPILNKITVDMHLGRMVLSFDEVIDEKNFLPSDVTVLNAPSGDWSLALSNETQFTRTTNGTALELTLTQENVNWIKAREIFTSVEDSFVSLTTDLGDVSGNNFVDILVGLAKQVTEFIPDRGTAQLLSFELFNIDNGSLLLLFNEPMNDSSFVPSAVSMVSGLDQSSTLYQLTGGSAVAVNDGKDLIMIILSSSDRVAIKLQSGLAKSDSNTFIALESFALLDRSQNSNEEVPLNSAVKLTEGRYIDDTSASSLSSASLNMDSGTLALRFDDVINAETFVPAFLTVQNQSNLVISISYTLDDSVHESENSDLINITLSSTDIKSLKSQLLLAKSAESTYVSFPTSIGKDIEGRSVIAVPSDNAIKVSEYFYDTTQPQLLSYNLDLDSGKMLMTFDEPILISSFNPSGITFQNSLQNPTTLYQLQGGLIVPLIEGADADTELTLELGTFDLNSLKSDTNLATAKSDSFITVDHTFITDTSNNFIKPISGSNAVSYIEDITFPELLQTTLDMRDGGKLIMKFSEAVKYTAGLLNSVRIQSSLTNPVEIIAFLDTTDVATKTGLDEITITLSTANTNKILLDSSIASSTSNAFISITTGGIYDYSQGGSGQSLAPVTRRIDKMCKPESKTIIIV